MKNKESKNSSISYFMNTKNWWQPLTFILIISLLGVGMIGYQTYVDAPPMSGFSDENGEIIGTVGSARDITERKKIEIELEQHRQHLELQQDARQQNQAGADQRRASPFHPFDQPAEDRQEHGARQSPHHTDGRHRPQPRAQQADRHIQRRVAAAGCHLVSGPGVPGNGIDGQGKNLGAAWFGKCAHRPAQCR